MYRDHYFFHRGQQSEFTHFFLYHYITGGEDGEGERHLENISQISLLQFTNSSTTSKLVDIF